MKTRRAIGMLIGSALLATSLGCAVINESLQGIQGRYGSSPFYGSQGGNVIDKLSGYKRYPGRIAVYNRTSEPVQAALMGVVQPNDVIAKKFYVGIGPNEFVGKESGRVYATIDRLSPNDHGRVFVITDQGVERR